MAERSKELLYSRPRKYIQCWGQDTTETGYVNIKELAEAMCRYDLDDMDLHWLKELNAELAQMGESYMMIIFFSGLMLLYCTKQLNISQHGASRLICSAQLKRATL